MRKSTKLILAVAAFAVVGVMLSLVGLNAMLGCESWDREQWSEEHSCTLGPFDD